LLIGIAFLACTLLSMPVDADEALRGIQEFLLSAPVDAEPAVDVEEFVIDDFIFSWTVAEVGDAKITISKGEGSKAAIFLTDGSTFSDLHIVNPKAIGRAMQRLDAYCRIRRGNKELKREKENVKVGEFIVTFAHSPQTGCWINIKGTGILDLNGATFNRRIAKHLAPYMLKADAMAAYVDKKIDDMVSP